MNKRLYRGQEKKLFGVCSGLAEYFTVDPVLVRALFVLSFLLFGSGLLLYIILAILMPERPSGGSTS